MTRRDFVWQAACAAVGAVGMASTVWDLRMINAAVAQTATPPTDYKALVCLFLYGGNDGNNMIVPTDSSYSVYQAARSNLALPQDKLLPIQQKNGDGRTFGLHPVMPEVQGLFNAGKVAAVCNVGTLLAPITRAQYFAGGSAVPPQLFSHSNQQIQWQTSVPDKTVRTGWGGRCADLLHSVYNAQSRLSSMSISLGGANTWEVGNSVFPYNVGQWGLQGLSAGGEQLQAIRDLIALYHSGNAYESHAARVGKSAMDNYNALSAAIDSATLTTQFPDNPAGRQLYFIAKIIKQRALLGQTRQIFFVSAEGYDTHFDQMRVQGVYLSQLSPAMKAFYDATVEMGVEQNVTAFTASDFGRTLPMNGGLGSDHGWGGHHLVMGGSVKGGDFYGTYPTLSVNGPDDTGQGRWIPTIAVDEYSSTLAKWFGVSDSNLRYVFPNLPRFARQDIGFMNMS